MLIRDISDARLTDAYGIRYTQIYPHGGEELAPWGFGRAVIEAGGATEPHAHEEHETFLILDGEGTMVIGDESAAVEAGQSVLIPAGEPHQLVNESTERQLVFLSIYWPVEHGAVEL
jgi:methionyl-tRNA synthetase